MPRPHDLQVGDRIRFITLPDEWQRPGYTISRESLVFMQQMIQRRYASRIAKIDSYGTPWIEARLKKRGRTHRHHWAIVEETGWRRVLPR